MIVGHKIEAYLTAERRDYGGHWDVTHHGVITELHATKGWRTVSHSRRVETVRQLPTIDQWRAADATTFERAQPKKERADYYQFPNEEARERALMRHGWYRRQKEKVARAAATEAWQQATQAAQ